MRIFDVFIVASTPIRTTRTTEGLIPDDRERVPQVAKLENLFVQKQNEETLVGNTRGLNPANIAHGLAVELEALKMKMSELNMASRS